MPVAHGMQILGNAIWPLGPVGRHPAQFHGPIVKNCDPIESWEEFLKPVDVPLGLLG